MANLTYPEELAVAAAVWNVARKEADKLTAQHDEIEKLRHEASAKAGKAYDAFMRLAEKADLQLYEPRTRIV